MSSCWTRCPISTVALPANELRIPRHLLVTLANRCEEDLERAGFKAILLKPVTPFSLRDTLLKIMPGTGEVARSPVSVAKSEQFPRGARLLLAEDNPITRRCGIAAGSGLRSIWRKRRKRSTGNPTDSDGRANAGDGWFGSDAGDPMLAGSECHPHSGNDRQRLRRGSHCLEARNNGALLKTPSLNLEPRPASPAVRHGRRW